MSNFFLGIVFSLITGIIFLKIRIGSLRQHAILILKQAEQEAEKKTFEAQLSLAKEFSAQQQIQQNTVQEKEQLLQGQKQLKRDKQQLEKDKKRLLKKEQSLSLSENEIIETVARISKYTPEMAKQFLLEQVTLENKDNLESHRKNLIKLAESTSAQKTFNILFEAMERSAHSISKEIFTLPIPIEDPTIIPRLIGKEGRNIQSLEQYLQVSCTIEENQLIISSLNPKNRYLAQQVIQQLVEHKKITPVTIRETHEKAIAAFHSSCLNEGRRICKKLEIQTLPSKVVQMLGTLHFRTSFSQNVLHHSLEVANFMKIIATSLQLNKDKAALMGLFHDIGKALSSEWGPSHALAGKAYLENFDISKDICNGVASHHGEEPPLSPEAHLLPICDRLSAQLPGVRTNKEHTFLPLVRECESRSKVIPGVLSAWAHYANTHIELIVSSDKKETDSLLKEIYTALSSLEDQIPIIVNVLASDKFSDTPEPVSSN